MKSMNTSRAVGRNKQYATRARENGSVDLLLDAVQDQTPVTGLTHTFYRYPARFSPSFARAAILNYTHPRDVVLDPFVGGGTSMVEAAALGRLGIGNDISSLATFLSTVKSRLYKAEQLKRVRLWIDDIDLNVRRPASSPVEWEHYQRHLHSPHTWRLRKVTELALGHLATLEPGEQLFARCVLLKAAQWALDCTTNMPSVQEFRDKLREFADEMIEGASQLSQLSRENARGRLREPIVINGSAEHLHLHSIWKTTSSPRLIVTSPPYAGVHVLYHRWQIQGRRETPAPFWIADSKDGAGESFYTFGDRHQPSLSTYFDVAQRCFQSLASVCNTETVLVQLVAFSKTREHLPRYMAVMRNAGWAPAEQEPTGVWRKVPNRKWYACLNNGSGSSEEVVLIHRLAR
jgi:hypothetical protein